MLDSFLLSSISEDDRAEVLSLVQDVSGGLAPFDPYLHWSVNRRELFVSQVNVVAKFKGGLFIVRYQDRLFLARQFLNTNGWFWSCVPMQNANPDNRMLLTMMEGAA